VCNTLATSCGSGFGTLAGSTCLCQSGYTGNGTDCTIETTSCTIIAPSDLNSPTPVSLGAGVSDTAFILNINVPFELTRTLTSVTFDASASSAYDYPVAFSSYERAVIEADCSDAFTISIPTSSIPSTILVTTTAASVEYAGTAYVTSVETLSDGSVRTINQELPFDYTFPIVTASIANINVVSAIGTVLKSNTLQQATTGNQITLEVKLSTPFPYQLAWLDEAPVTGPTFTGTDVVVPTFSPALTPTVSAASACASTAQGATCVQTATVSIDYSSGCSVDGSYTLNFAVAGCNIAGGTTPTTDCLVDNNDAVENIPVVVTISSLAMGDLCLVAKVYSGSAAPLAVYADSSFSIVKNTFVASDAAQSLMYIESTLTLGDAPSIAAYTGFEIMSVARMCAGISNCTGSYISLPSNDVIDTSSDNLHVKFNIPVADFAELTPEISNIPYSILLTVELLFNDNSKRSVTSTINSKRATQSTVSTLASGNVQFVATNQDNNDATQKSSANKLASFAIATLCMGAVAIL